MSGDKIIPPERTVRYDPDDPYLVVAADKGTATFSDTANALAAEYGFWLGDAFASGGSAGYDHKKMGITAKGAWECVKRHFRELGLDTQSNDFTVAGIGDRRATFSAMACYCRRTFTWWQRSITSTSSSTRTGRGTLIQGTRAALQCARRGRTTTRS